MAEVWLDKEEYLTLRKEVEAGVAELAPIEKGCVAGVAFVFAFVSKDSASYPTFASFAWLMPIFIPLYGALKSWVIGKHLRVVGQYLRNIETRYPPAAGGWEGHISQREKFEHHAKFGTIIWGGFFVLTTIGSVVGFVGSLSNPRPPVAATVNAKPSTGSMPSPASSAVRK